jgi:hypothetical protein
MYELELLFVTCNNPTAFITSSHSPTLITLFCFVVVVVVAQIGPLREHFLYRGSPAVYAWKRDTTAQVLVALDEIVEIDRLHGSIVVDMTIAGISEVNASYVVAQLIRRLRQVGLAVVGGGGVSLCSLSCRVVVGGGCVLFVHSVAGQRELAPSFRS